MVASRSSGAGRTTRQERQRATLEAVARRRANRRLRKLVTRGIPIDERNQRRQDNAKAESVRAARINRMERLLLRRAIWKRLVPREGPTSHDQLKYISYRYWECRACGFDPDDVVQWEWFVKLHWAQRDELRRLHRYAQMVGKKL